MNKITRTIDRLEAPMNKITRPIHCLEAPMNKITRTIAALVAVLFIAVGLSACSSSADTASKNLSKAAENFEVPRRIVGINTITDTVLWSVEGYCSYETGGDTVDVICAVDSEDRKNSVMRTTMGDADNVTFVSTQLTAVDVDFFRPRIIFRPETIVPNFDLSTGDNPTDTSGDN